MSSSSSSASPSAGVAKFDMRLGPDTDGAALAIYRQNIELLFKLEISEDAARRFSSHSVTYQLPHAVLASVESVAQSLSRGPAEIARGGDQFVIYFQVSGELDATYGGQRRQISRGDVVLIDYTRDIVSHATDFRIFYLMVTRDRVPAAFLAPSAHGAVFKAESARGRILSQSMTTLFQTIGSLTVVEAEIAVDALLSLCAGLLQGLLTDDAAAASLGDETLAKAIAYIDRNLANPELSPAVLKGKIPLSRSSLYRLFEPSGGVRNFILQRRLDRSAKALLTAGALKPGLKNIARDNGFRSQAHLSRAFRKRFGITPYQFYDLVRRNDRAGLAAQAKRAGFSNLQSWIEHVSRPDLSPEE